MLKKSQRAMAFRLIGDPGENNKWTFGIYCGSGLFPNIVLVLMTLKQALRRRIIVRSGRMISPD